VCGDEDWLGGAEVLHRAFSGKGESLVYDEFRTLDGAQYTVRQYRSGAYGRVERDWARVSWDGGDMRGIILGTGISSEVGFIFQVAVDPGFQRHGVGTTLMGDLLEVYRRAGMDRAMLGVTLEDGAYRLYRRLGFEDVRLVRVYVLDSCS
jgi:ribosomal protein S18 acetylase RimI-like enzyme